MTTPTPSPRPPDLVAAMCSAFTNTPPFRAGAQGPKMLAAIKAASDAGYVLIPRAELEEAADTLELASAALHSHDRAGRLATALRQRSRA